MHQKVEGITEKAKRTSKPVQKVSRENLGHQPEINLDIQIAQGPEPADLDLAAD